MNQGDAPPETTPEPMERAALEKILSGELEQ